MSSPSEIVPLLGSSGECSSPISSVGHPSPSSSPMAGAVAPVERARHYFFVTAVMNGTGGDKRSGLTQNSFEASVI